MAHSQPTPPIVLFHYPFSPWAQKVTTYLAFRGIPYLECHQPVTMPRPELAQLGVKYRRIPVMSIGRDIYCDTLLILEKLEELYPGSHMSATNGFDLGLERLLEKWTDVIVFKYAAAAIPTDFSVMKDEKFVKDRTELWGRDWQSHHQEKLRPEALLALKNNFDFLENTLLKDGRKWLLGGQNPGLADIHAAWILRWLFFDIPGALPEDLFSEKTYPRVVAFLERYGSADKTAKDRAPKPTLIEGPEAVAQILKSDFAEPGGEVDGKDPSALKKGEEVESWPVDTGSNHRDRGALVAITQQEVVIQTTAEGNTKVHVHHPRWQFQVEAAKASKKGN